MWDSELECAQQRNSKGVAGVSIMEKRVQLKKWRCGLNRLHDLGWEFWWIGGEPSAFQYVVWQLLDRGLHMSCHGWLGQLEGFFHMDEIKLIKMASCDGLDIGILKYSSDHDIAYLRLELFSQLVFDPGG